MKIKIPIVDRRNVKERFEEKETEVEEHDMMWNFQIIDQNYDDHQRKMEIIRTKPL